jgi:hypothetical protein
VPDADDDLAAELRALGRDLTTPALPDLREAVRARLTEPPARPAAARRSLAPRRPAAPRWSLAPRRPAARWLVAAAAAVLAGIVLLVPPARTAAAAAAVAVLNFAGIVIDGEPGAAPPPATPSPLPGSRTVPLDEARRLAAFTVAVPARLGPPESVEIADPDQTGAPRVVTLLYRDGALRLDQFDGRLDFAFAKKSAASGLIWTDVGGADALWLPAPHPIAYIGRDGVTRTETARLAGATLVWQGTGVTYRLEGRLTQDEAMAIAGSVG